MGHLGHLHGQILDRSRLHGVVQIDIPLPMTSAVPLLRDELAGVRIKWVVRPTLGGMGAVDAAAGDVASHEFQSRDAESAQVEVVAGLPGALAGAVEICVLDGVGQIDRVAAHKVEWRVAVDFLIGQREPLGAEGVLARQAVRRVINPAGHGVAVILNVVDVAVQKEPGLLQMQVGVVLTPGVAQLGRVQSTAQRLVFEQLSSEKTDVASGGAHPITAEVPFAGRGILILERGEAPGLQMHVGELLAVEQKPRGVLRLQAFVGGVEHRGFHGHLTVGQGGSGRAHFQRATGAGEVAFTAAIRIQRQQSSAGMALAAIQFQTEKTMGIDTESDITGGKAGGKCGDEALSSFLLVAFVRRGGGSVVILKEEVAAQHVQG